MTDLAQRVPPLHQRLVVAEWFGRLAAEWDSYEWSESAEAMRIDGRLKIAGTSFPLYDVATIWSIRKRGKGRGGSGRVASVVLVSLPASPSHFFSSHYNCN